MTVVSTLFSCVMLAVTLTRKSILMMRTRPKETITQSVTTMTASLMAPTSAMQNVSSAMTISSNVSLPLTLTTPMSGLPSVTVTASTASFSPRPSPILPSSNLASVFVDGGTGKDGWGILIWQDGAGSLSFVHGGSELKGQGRIEDVLEDAPKAKDGTPMAAVADDTSVAHLFYLDESDAISHVFTKSGGGWKRGGLSRGRKRTAAHSKSMLSAAFHQGEHDTRVVVLSYQSPDGNLRLTMSEDPKNDDEWYTVDFNSFAGRRGIGDWGGIGHAIAGDWQNKRQDPDGSFSGLLMAVEEGEEITPWECSVDFHASSKKQAECHVLGKTFSDSSGRGISISSRANQFAWVRTGHGKSKAPAETLPYEFAFLCVDSEGIIRENRVGIDVARISGPGINVDMSFDSFAANSNKTVYAKSGNNVVAFRLDADGWQWKVDGFVNTTIPDTSP
ncbi:hypothetical protein Trco_004978 [Trichoderma cornu-damae]|uniref:Fucose-specific lectin n=1 Tax=Trichoderma cornu-damae TaxID=654480 RepID=A0A9P8QGP5_9HYPO|nr:hypothetical protein Trco_004978 [Trichoderma cornu-damae]